MSTSIKSPETDPFIKSKPLLILDWTLTMAWWGLIILATLSLILVPILVSTAEVSSWSLITAAEGIDLSNLEVTNAAGEKAHIELPNEFIYLKIDIPVNESERLAFAASVLLLIATTTAYCLYIIRMIRQILASVKSGDPFAPSNAKRIRVIGLLLIGGSLVTTIVESLSSLYAVNEYSASGFDFIFRFDFEWTAIFLGLGILVLSEIFREGTRIREEQSLTV